MPEALLPFHPIVFEPTLVARERLSFVAGDLLETLNLLIAFDYSWPRNIVDTFPIPD